MIRCMRALSHESIAEYLAGELGPEDEDAFEQHLYGCDDCTRVAERVAALTSALRETIPPVVTTARLSELRGSLSILETQVEAGERAEARFAPEIDLLVHALHADLAGARRVDLEVCAADGTPYMRVEAVPFDAHEGVVYVACQRHLRGDDDVEDTRFRLVSVHGADLRVLGDYTVRHHWGPRL